MSIYLIDYENVNLSGLNGIETLSPMDRVYLFYGANPGYIPFEKHILIAKTPAEVTYLKVDRSGKNYLDFQLSTYSGYLVAMYNEQEYVIVSRDTGFDSIVNFWNQDLEGRGVHFTRREAIVAPARPQPIARPQPVVPAAQPAASYVPTRPAPQVPAAPAAQSTGGEESGRSRSRRRSRGGRGGASRTAAPIVEQTLPMQEETEVTAPIPAAAEETVEEVAMEVTVPTEVTVAEPMIQADEQNEVAAEAITEIEESAVDQAPAEEVEEVKTEEVKAEPIVEAPTKNMGARSVASAGNVVPGASASGKAMPKLPFLTASEEKPAEAEAPATEEITLAQALGEQVEELMSEGAEEAIPVEEPAVELAAEHRSRRSRRSSRFRGAQKEDKIAAPVAVIEPEASKANESKAEDVKTELAAPKAEAPKKQAAKEAQPQLRLADRFKSRIRDAVKEEGLNSGGYTQIYNRVLKCDNKSRLNNELVKAFSQEKGGRIYKLILPVYEDYRKSLEG